MKRKVKLLALVLSFVLLMSAVLTSCDSSNEEVTTDQADTNASDTITETVIETEEVDVPDIPVKDYDEQLYMMIYGGDSAVKFLWVEESDASLLSQAVYERQINLMNHLGVELVYIPTQGWLGYNEPFKQSVKNKDGAIDVFLPSGYLAIAEMIEEGYMYNLDNIDAFDFEADYWDMDFMDSIALDGHHYLGYSDFNVMKAYVVTFNKEMLAKYQDSLDESIYDSVYNYHWTIDKMLALANLVYIDATGDGKTADDTFGISAKQWQPFVPFLMASDIRLVDMNEKGMYEVSVMSEINAPKTLALVDKLKGLAESDCAWLQWLDDPNVAVIPLHTNRTLMNLSFTSELDQLLNYDVTFGILPYPMFDEAQKDVGYLSMNRDTYIVLPSYMRNEQMITESIELLSYYSSDVRNAVFEKWLGKQAADAPDDVKMLNIVWDNLYSDFGYTYSTIASALDNNLYMLPTVTKAGSDKTATSYIASYTRAANNAIAKYMKKIQSMNK